MLVVRITDLDAAWTVRSHGPRLRAVRRASDSPRQPFATGPRVSVGFGLGSRAIVEGKVTRASRPAGLAARPAEARA